MSAAYIYPIGLLIMGIVVFAFGLLAAKNERGYRKDRAGGHWKL